MICFFWFVSATNQNLEVGAIMIHSGAITTIFGAIQPHSGAIKIMLGNQST